MISDLLFSKHAIVFFFQTFETHLAPKAKQNRLHHKMVNDKKYISYKGGSKKCNLRLKEELNILKDFK